MLVSLIAYRGTGKDTLVRSIHDVSSLDWKLYGLNGSKLKIPISKVCRVAYADKLKMEVSRILGLDQIQNPSLVHSSIQVTHPLTCEEWVKLGWFDKLKDVSPNEIKLVPLNGKTVRRWAIDVAVECKQKYGPTYFLELVENEIKEKLQCGYTVFITDVRYPTEILPESITIRLFRSEIDIPPVEEHSERSLDKYVCAYVLCKSTDDFNKLRTIQPQYQDYSYLGLLTDFMK